MIRLYWQEVFAAARTLHTALKPDAVRLPDELSAAFSQISRKHCRAVMVMSSALYVGARVPRTLAGQHRVAASYDNRIIAHAGGLMSWGHDGHVAPRRYLRRQNPPKVPSPPTFRSSDRPSSI
jgi:hypothetical protein